MPRRRVGEPEYEPDDDDSFIGKARRVRKSPGFDTAIKTLLSAATAALMTYGSSKFVDIDHNKKVDAGLSEAQQLRNELTLEKAQREKDREESRRRRQEEKIALENRLTTLETKLDILDRRR